jgi:hypothetical protein
MTIFSALSISSTSRKKLTLTDIKKTTDNTVALEGYAPNLSDDSDKFGEQIRGVVREFPDFAMALKNAEDQFLSISQENYNNPYL